MDQRWLGRIDYSTALDLQQSLLQQRMEGKIPDTALFLEHEPVYTIGRTRDRSSLPEAVESLPHPVVEISRGGKATYHGPGQLVGYFIVDLRGYGQDLHAYLRTLEASLIALCRDFTLEAQRREGLTGVWIAHRKIASIGVGVRRWVTLHGIALNVQANLEGFAPIVPCGLDGVSMTSLEDELPGQCFTVEAVAERYFPHLATSLAQLSKDAAERKLRGSDSA